MNRHKYSIEELIVAVESSFSIVETCRKLNIRPVGGNYKTLKIVLERNKIDISHFTGQGWNKGLKFVPKPAKSLVDILVENSDYVSSNNLKKRLIKERYKEKKCEICGLKD
jgi:hypothetical protein